MEMRQQELNHFAQHLHRAGLALKLEEDRLTAERDQQARQRGLIEQAEAGLQKQRDELARMMAELHALHQTVRDREEAALQLLRRENAQLRQSLDMSVADSCQLATSGRET